MFQKKFRGVKASKKTKNCGLLLSCCESQSKIDKVLDRIVDTCDHFTYEGHMPLFERISAKKPNTRLLIRKTHEGDRLANKLLNSKRTPFSSSSSLLRYTEPLLARPELLGHDLRAGRMNSYGEKLSGVSSDGYVLDNHLHHSFETDNTTAIIELLQQSFFWCKSFS